VATAREYKKRIHSVKNTQQMTRAMKMVSAAKLRRAQESILATRPYALKLKEILSGIAARADISDHFLLMRRPLRHVRVFILTSDRGLCGSFNAGILRKSLLFLKENETTFDEAELGFIGRRGHEFFKKRNKPIFNYYENILDDLSYASAALITKDILDHYRVAQLDAVFFIYNEFKSAIAQKVVVEQLLPISRKDLGDVSGQVDYLYEPDKQQILDEILPKHISIQVYRMLLETTASEHGARMTAMDSASRNASEMMDRLTLLANRLRQQAITTELVEIVSGAEALSAR